MTVPEQTRISTGIVGLDVVLCDGLIPNRAYLIHGKAGTGKTTLGLHFLTADDVTEEPSLCITFGETVEQLTSNARSIGMDVNNVHFLDLSPTSQFFQREEIYNVFSASEIERGPLAERITETMDALRPARVFIDAMTQLHYLTNNEHEFRRYIVSFLRFMMERQTTILFSSEDNSRLTDEDLRFISDGVIQLENHVTYRTIQVEKFRGSSMIEDTHTMRLTETGMKVFPRLIQPESPERDLPIEPISSGIPKLDEMLHGGLERGTVTLFTGPTGVGKTTMGLQFMKEAAERGERSVIYTFEEDELTIRRRCEGINLPVQEMLGSGMLSIVQIEPLQFTPDEFAHMVRREVEDNDARIVMIDSISGYRLSVEGDDLIKHLHIQTKYLRTMGVTVILINEIHRIADPLRVTELNVSYLMDSIIFMRYIEVNGTLRRIIGVLKKRVSDFEKTVREVKFSASGIRVSKPLTGIQGVLTGNPALTIEVQNSEHEEESELT